MKTNRVSCLQQGILKLRITALCEGNQTVSRGFPSQNVCNVERFPMSCCCLYTLVRGVYTASNGWIESLIIQLLGLLP